MNKKSKADPTILYQYHPNGYEKCLLCAMFYPPDSCSAVEGFIARQGWCKIWESKNTLGLRK